jgi:acyl carrier protein
VELLAKRGIHNTEMNRFRYDVVLRVGDDSAADRGFMHELNWQADELSLPKLQAILRQEPETLRVTGVPNRRVTQEIRALALLGEVDGSETVRDLRMAQQELQEPGVEPDEIRMLDSTYSVQVQLSPLGRADSCDVVMRRTDGLRQEDFDSTNRLQPARRSWTSYANDPLRGALKLNLAPELREYLNESLPDYMVPAVFVMLEAVPLTPNGKVDRRALPVPDDARPELKQAYVEPASSLERTIQAIWREVLQIERVGTRDNFFDLGGHSLRLVMVHSKLVQILSRELSVVDLFQYPTISSLAQHLAGGEEQQKSLHEAQERAQKQRDTLRRRAILAQRRK